MRVLSRRRCFFGRKEDGIELTDFARSMGTFPQPRYTFDVDLLGYCPRLLVNTRLPAVTSNVFLRQCTHGEQCFLPHLNMYLAGAGSVTMLHVAIEITRELKLLENRNIFNFSGNTSGDILD